MSRLRLFASFLAVSTLSLLGSMAVAFLGAVPIGVAAMIIALLRFEAPPALQTKLATTVGGAIAGMLGLGVFVLVFFLLVAFVLPKANRLLDRKLLGHVAQDDRGAKPRR